jgi:hypothetical protein
LTLLGCIASVVDAFACLAFLLLPTTPATRARLYIMLFIDPLARIIGYSAMYQRLLDAKPIWAELGFYPLIFGTLLLTGQNALQESARLNFLTLNYSTANGLDFLLELLVTFTLPFGLAIYAWLIASSLPLRRWLGFMMAPQVVLLFITLGSFAFPPAWRLGDFAVGHCLCDYSGVCESGLVFFAGSQGK